MTRVIHLISEEKDLVYMTEDDSGKIDASLWICLNAEEQDKEKLYAPGPPPPDGMADLSFDEIAVTFSVLGYRVLKEGEHP